MKTSILETEIYQQPQIIAEFLEKERDSFVNIAKELRGKFKYVLIAARGTSDNAARYAQYLFGSHNHIQVALATPSLFTLYQTPPDLSEALVLGISQSGQSPDIVAVLAEAQRQGRPTLALVNKVDSPLAKTADYVIPLHAGEERAVAATKSYTASLAALAMFSASLHNDDRRMRELNQIPAWIEAAFQKLEPQIERIERYTYMEQCVVIGRGFNYSTAFEIALKIKELTRIIAEPYSSADFRHGPIATVHPHFPVILINPEGSVYKDMEDLIHQLKTLEAERIIISNNNALLQQAKFPLPIPAGPPEWLTPIVAVLPGQLFALKLALAKGLDADHPVGLTKVTETL